MKFNGLVLSVLVVAVAGCGKATLNSSTSGTTSSPTTAASTNMTVSSPNAGAAVSSPFQVSATATACQSQGVSAIGYSIDAGAATQVTGTALQAQANAAAGTHTLHVLAWGANGASCTADVPITVSANGTSPANPPTAGGSGPEIPANAATVSEIQQLPDWQGDFDGDTGGGSANGTMSLVSSPSLSGEALDFQTTFTNNGGERYHATFGTDPTATHFLLDTSVYIASPSDAVANLELDMNQVMANGQTVIYGFQCDGYSGTWDVTQNSGTAAAPVDKWIHTGAACNPRNWTTDAWHRVQILFSRDDTGNVTYQSVWFDGTEQQINQTAPSAFALGWNSVLLVNVQIDGRGASGSSTVYVDQFSVSRW